MNDKIVVPEGMLKAASSHVDVDTANGLCAFSHIKIALEAALRWQSSRSPDISSELLDLLARDAHVSKEAAYDIVDLALRRMYLAPEPEVPEEIKGMQKIDLASIKGQEQLDRLVDKLNVISFNRGMEKGRKDIINKHNKRDEVQSLLIEEMAKELVNLITRDENLTRNHVDMLISNAFLCGRESVVSIFEEQENSGKFTKEEIIEGIKSICDSRHGIGDKI